MSRKFFQTPTRILAIDPGFGRLGYAALEKTNSSQKIIEAGCAETSPKIKYEDRLLEIGDKIKNLIQKHAPEVLAIEKIYFTKNQKTVLQIAEVRGLILYLALSNGLKISEFTPLEVKIAVCGYGKADKIQIARMVKSILKLNSLPKIDDTIDAIAIGLTYFAKNKYGEII